jgi:hypothetical protein
MAKLIITLPYWLIIKVEDGLYEIDIYDENKKIIEKGYTWCTNEYRYKRRKAIMHDIKSGQVKLPKKYSIRIKRIILKPVYNAFTFSYDFEYIIRVNKDFTLKDDNFIIHENIKKYEHIKRRHKEEVNLYECSIIKNNNTVDKYFIYAKNKTHATRVLRIELFKIFVAHKIVFRQYKKDGNIVWTNLASCDESMFDGTLFNAHLYIISKMIKLLESRNRKKYEVNIDLSEDKMIGQFDK